MARKPTINSDSVAQDQIRAFIERIERMEEEKKAISDDIREIYQEARGNGFDTVVLRQIVKLRKQDANERMEREALLELYMGALGMQTVMRFDDEDDEPPRRTANLSSERAPSITKSHTATTAAAQAGESPSPQGSPADNSELPKAAGATIPSNQLGARPEGSPEIGGNPEANNSTAAVEKKPSRQSHKLEIAGASPAPATNIEPSGNSGEFTQSTAPRSDVGDNTTEASGHGQRLDPAAGTTLPAGEAPPVDTNVPEPLRHASRSEPTDIAGKERPESASTNSEVALTPVKAGQARQAGEGDGGIQAPSSAPDPETREGSRGETPGTPVAAEAGEAFATVSPVVARPDGCLNPDVCASSSWRHLCHSCAKANLVPVGLTIGAADIPHEGSVY